jgi:transposase-like protein
MSTLDGIRRELESLRSELNRISQDHHDIKERVDKLESNSTSSTTATQSTASRSTTTSSRTATPSATKS